MEFYSIVSKFCSSMNWWTVFAIAAALLWNWWRKPHARFPPGPRGFPFVGVLPFAGKHPERAFKKWSFKYGPVLSVRLAYRDVVVLNTFETINQALVRQSNIFSGRPSVELYTQVLGRNGILFADYDEKFKAQKKFGASALKNLGMGRKKMEEIINEELEYFVEFLKQYVDKPVYLGVDLHNVIGNVICKMTFGRRFDYDDESFKSIFRILKETYSDPEDSSKIVALLLFFKYLKYIPPFSKVNKRVVKSEIDMAAGFQPHIDQHKETFDKNCIRDFIDAYIYEQKFGVGKDDPNFTDRQLNVYVRDLILAGTETSSTTLSWILLSLLHYPKFQTEIVKEIDKVIGHGQYPSLQNKAEMPFTCAFIEEVFRYTPVVPLSVHHQTLENVEFGDAFIPKGTLIIPNVWGAHFDPETWKNPYEFNPYRHINDEGKFVSSMKVIPFGIGPRYCIGESMARAEVFLSVTKLLQKFELRSTGEPLPGLLDGLTTIVHSPKKYEIILSIR